MDKFDEIIKNAQQPYELNGNFVEVTMKQIHNQQPKKWKSFKIWAPALVGALAVVAIIFTIWPFGSSKTANSHSANVTPPVSQSSTATQAAVNGTPAAGTDDATLTSDLNGINSSMSQENTDQSSANSALNDQSRQIAVPTD